MQMFVAINPEIMSNEFAPINWVENMKNVPNLQRNLSWLFTRESRLN